MSNCTESDGVSGTFDSADGNDPSNELALGVVVVIIATS